MCHIPTKGIAAFPKWHKCSKKKSYMLKLSVKLFMKKVSSAEENDSIIVMALLIVEFNYSS